MIADKTTPAERCADCGAPACFGIFNGTKIRQACDLCAVRRCNGPVPGTALGAEWILGHAAHTNEVFVTPKRPLGEVFRRGSFRDHLEHVVLGVDHQCCRCIDPGRSWHVEPHSALIDPALVFASAEAGTLLLAEDPYGLFFAARIPRDACVAQGDSEFVNIHDFIARGQCLGLSLHSHGGARVLHPSIPADLFVFSDVALQEISLCIHYPLPPASPGTWVMPAGRGAMVVLYERLRSAAGSLQKES